VTIAGVDEGWLVEQMSVAYGRTFVVIPTGRGGVCVCGTLPSHDCTPGFVRIYIFATEVERTVCIGWIREGWGVCGKVFAVTLVERSRPFQVESGRERN